MAAHQKDGAKFADKILAAVEAAIGKKLHKDLDTDPLPDGYMSTSANNGIIKILICLYGDDVVLDDATAADIDATIKGVVQ